MGRELGLIVIGHSASEEAGSEFMANWLREQKIEVPITHIPSNNLLIVG